MKDHKKRELVDVLTKAAIEFGATQQLRARIADIVLPALNSAADDKLDDADRLDWLRDNLFTHKWNGVVGKGCAVQWQVAPDFRFKQRELSDDTGITAGDFRRAIDAARRHNAAISGERSKSDVLPSSDELRGHP